MSKLSPEALAELQKSDPAAFDLDPVEAKPDETDPAVAAKPDEAKPDEQKDPDTATAAKPEGSQDDPPRDEKGRFAAKDDDAKPDVIPKPRFDEVISERNAERERREAAERRAAELEAQLAAAQKGPTRDFDAEINALEQKFDEGDIDFKEYQKQHATLVADKVRAEIAEKAAEERKQAAEQTAEQQWQAAQARFFGEAENAELIDTRAKKVAFVDAVQQVAEAGGAATYDDMLAKAAEIVRRELPAAPKKDVVDPHAARRAADAAAATAASATPAPIAGGVGNRAGVDQALDLKNLKPGAFSKLPKDQQEKLLGAGAL